MTLCRLCGGKGYQDFLGGWFHVLPRIDTPGGPNWFREEHRFLPPRQPKPEPRQASWDGNEYGEDAHGRYDSVEERYLEGWES